MAKRVHFAAVGRELHVDVPLSNVALDYQPPELIAPMIAPVVEVPNISGSFPTFSRRDRLATTDDSRAPGTEANIIRREVGSDSYFCLNHALKTRVNLEDRSNADPIYVQKLYNGAAEFIAGKLGLNWENRIALQCTSGSNVGSYAAVASAWTDHENSAPLENVLTGIDNVQDTTGVRPRKVTFGELSWRHFRRNTTVRNLIFGTNNGGGYPSRQQVADLLEVDEILVGAAYKDTANRQQTESLSQIWADNVLIHYTPDNPSIFVPSFMYSFRWAVAGVPNMQAERHGWDRKTKSEETEVGYYQVEKITGSEYAFLIVATNSST